MTHTLQMERPTAELTWPNQIRQQQIFARGAAVVRSKRETQRLESRDTKPLTEFDLKQAEREQQRLEALKRNMEITAAAMLRAA